MNKELLIFKDEKFGEIRTFDNNGEILFCGVDVANALCYSNTRKAINDHCKYVTKRYVPHPQSDYKDIEMAFIPESDLYRLIIKAADQSINKDMKENAEKFERWVFDEVLPTIRKHGAYMTTNTIEKVMNDPDSWIRLLTALKDERSQKEQLQLEATINEPKVIFANAVAVSDDTILIRELAKILKGNGISIGEKRLFEKLREDGFLIKARNDDYNTPTQRAMELKLFVVKETTIHQADGSVLIRFTPKVTGKGQQYFVNYFLKIDKAM